VGIGPIWLPFGYCVRRAYYRRVLSSVPSSAAIRPTCRTILPVVLYGCETWYLTFREEHRLWVYGKRVLRNIFGTKREEVTRDWKRLHNKELYDKILTKSYSGTQIK
jgi:hypothetical protein